LLLKSNLKGALFEQKYPEGFAVRISACFFWCWRISSASPIEFGPKIDVCSKKSEVLGLGIGGHL
jgi:hypothetical protein